MKRILWFVGLKIGEILGVGIVYYCLCWLGKLGWFIIGTDIHENFWTYGIWGAMSLIIVCGAAYLLYQLFKANWEKAGRLANRGKK